MSDTKHETNIQKKIKILRFAKIYVHKNAKILKFAKINARQIIERAIRKNKCSRKLMLAKVNVLRVLIVIEGRYWAIMGTDNSGNEVQQSKNKYPKPKRKNSRNHTKETQRNSKHNEVQKSKNKVTQKEKNKKKDHKSKQKQK